MADLQPVIIKKIKKGGHGHHGGAWKVAYADFVTAMMAFFLLLWLLNAVTDEQLEGISNYFAPSTASSSTSGAGGVLGGLTVGEQGAVERAASRDSISVNLPPPKAGEGSVDDEDKTSAPEELDDSDAEQLLQKREQEQFEDAEKAIKEAIGAIPQLKQLADSLLIDNTPEGMRIQIVDQKGLAMFPSGGAKMYLHTKKILELVSRVILSMPQDLSISGHTDATKFITDEGYSNWELSADRANASRRELIHFGVPEDRFARIVGLADKEPLLIDDPEHPKNRRLSIILIRGTGQQQSQPQGVPQTETEQPG